MNKVKYFWYYITFRRYVEQGQSEFYWLKGIIVIVGILSIWLKTYFPTLPFYFGIIFGFIILFGWLFIGWYWDYKKLFHLENQWNNERNPFVDYMKTAEIEIKFDETANKYIGKFINSK